MFDGRQIIALVPAYNEEVKIVPVVQRTLDSPADRVVVIDDGSSDRTAEVAKEAGAEVISHPCVRGVGAALRTGIDYARSNGFDVAVILAGNNKDNPAELPRLLGPICRDGYDFVVGSRYLPGGVSGGDIPQYRRLATRLHPWLMGLFTGRRLTESTNGFRAFRLSMLDDPRIRMEQRWLDGYGLEVYLLWKALKLGFRHKEVPCTKIYPSKRLGYTKMKPVIGWWSILRPIFLLGLGLRQ